MVSGAIVYCSGISRLIIGGNMTKPYLIMINNVLAKRKLTLQGAKKEKEVMEHNGMKNISIAYDNGYSYVR